MIRRRLGEYLGETTDEEFDDGGEKEKSDRGKQLATPGRGRNTILLVRCHFSDSLLVAEEGRSQATSSPLLLVEVGTASFLLGATFSDMPDSLGLNPRLSFGTLGTVHSRQII